MTERIQKRDVIIPSLLLACISTAMFAKEIPILQGHPDFHSYIAGRVFVILLCMVCITLAILEVEAILLIYPIVFFFSTLFYEGHGQYFQPNYWLAYIQVTSIFPFIFSLDRKTLALLLVTGLILFDGVLFTTSKEFISKGSFSKELFSDIIIGTVISTLISYIGASVFFAEKMKRNQIYQRFIDLGKNMSFIVHDIKGMISGPCTYVDILSQKLSEGEISENELQLMGYLKEDIDAIRDFVMEMNLLVSSHITDKKNPIKVSAVVKSIRKVFKSKIKNIKIEVIGDMTLMIKIDFLNRIIINSIINSCEAIHKNNVANGRVVIYCEDNLLGIADNSGEQLDQITLKKLNNPYLSFSNKEQGSGIGILLIKDYINAIGGKFQYGNHVDGVDLKISFPRNILL